MLSNMPKYLLLLLVLSPFMMVSVGCGSNVKEGVADAPDEPEPVLTEEEQKTEAQSARQAAGQGN